MEKQRYLTEAWVGTSIASFSVPCVKEYTITTCLNRISCVILSIVNSGTCLLVLSGRLNHNTGRYYSLFFFAWSFKLSACWLFKTSCPVTHHCTTYNRIRNCLLWALDKSERNSYNSTGNRWACSAVGSAPHSHCGGRGFESLQVHQAKSHPKGWFFAWYGIYAEGIRTIKCNSPGGARGAPPVAGGATWASGRGRQMRKAFESRRRCRAPQQGLSEE